MIVSEHQFNLPTGMLTLNLDASAKGALDDYLHVEARLNPKRGFLFVSHLLGKHVATALGRLRKGHNQLARKLYSSLEGERGDVLVIGMAETATLLGYGVWRSLTGLMRDGSAQAFFLQTTRYRDQGPAWAFEESHSHAPQQWIQGLGDERLSSVRHVVLVDDELSTGRTFWALEHLIREHLPEVLDVQWACLTDFRPEIHQNHPAQSLLKGTWTFVQTKTLPDLPVGASHPVSVDQLDADFGRAVPLNLSDRATRVARAKSWLDGVTVKGRVLVIGTGEFMPLPFELAEIIEDREGVDTVDFQATTRSPALMPSVKLGADHYGEGVDQFIYNYNRKAYDTVLMMVETPDSPASRDLGARLEATVIGPPARSTEALR